MNRRCPTERRKLNGSRAYLAAARSRYARLFLRTSRRLQSDQARDELICCCALRSIERGLYARSTSINTACNGLLRHAFRSDPGSPQGYGHYDELSKWLRSEGWEFSNKHGAMRYTSRRYERKLAIAS